MIKTLFNYLPFFLIGVLIFVLPIPHTIAIRNFCFYILTINILFLVYTNYKSLSFDFFKSKIMNTFYVLFSLVLLSSFFSMDFVWSIDEFRGQWFTYTLYIIVGSFFTILIVNNKINLSIKNLMLLIFITLFIHILYIDLYVSYHYLKEGVFIKRYGGLIVHPTLANYISNILFSFVIAEFIYRVRTSNHFLNVSNFLLFVIFILVIFSIFIESMRLGMISILFMFLMTVFFLFYNSNTKFIIKSTISIILFCLFVIPVYININTDKRWNTLYKTIDIAMDTENNRYWLNSKSRPTFENGEEVNRSNYLRIAFLSEGLKLIKENPFGYGYSRNAFGYAINNKYNEGKGKHAHSSIIDFTIGSGVIALSVLLIFFYSILKESILSFKKEITFIPILLFFLVSGFLSRSFVDANMRDHNLLLFGLILSVCLVSSFYEKCGINETKIN